MHQYHIIIVPDSLLSSIDWVKNGKSFVVQKSKFMDEILIAPNFNENFLGTNLFLFKELCNKKVVSYGRLNYFPFHTMFADEVLLSGDNQVKPVWYDVNDDISENKTNLEGLTKRDTWVDVISKMAEMEITINPDALARKYYNKPIYIRQSSFDLFQQLSHKYPKDILVCEFKSPGTYMNPLKKTRELLSKLNAVGLSYSFQRSLLSEVGIDHYLSFQILASLYLNWVFLCIGGSANLLSVVPVKSLLLSDDYISDYDEYIIRILSILRYGQIGNEFPIIGMSKDDEDISERIDVERLMYGLSEFAKVPKPTIEFLKKKPMIL